MSFVDDINKVVLKLDAADAGLAPAIVAEVYNEIVFGSPITGAPGQVVADVNGGDLRASWSAHSITADCGEVSTKSQHAEQNEDGIARPGGGPYVQRSAIGGRWNVALVRTNFQRLVDHVVNAGRRPEGWTDNSALNTIAGSGGGP